MLKKDIRKKLDYAFFRNMWAVVNCCDNKRYCTNLLNECKGILYSALMLNVISAEDHKIISEMLTNLIFGDMYCL